jgi:hypothetical protein
MPALAYIGESDCEAIGDGLLRQPANAISSMAYLGAAFVVLTWTGSAARRERLYRRVLAALLAATGVGSVLYHGPQTGPSHYLHDVTFLSLLWFVAATNLTSVRSMGRRPTLGIAAAGTVAILVIRTGTPASANVMAALLVLIVVVSDFMVRRAVVVAAPWYPVALAVAGLAVAALVAGRTGSPICAPGSPLQAHAVWHVLSAIAIAGYFVATSPARIEAGEPV